MWRAFNSVKESPWAAAAFRQAPRSGTGRGSLGGADDISSSHQDTKSSSDAMASSRMKRASASTDRPCAVARRRRAGFSASGRFRISRLSLIDSTDIARKRGQRAARQPVASSRVVCRRAR